MKTIVEDPILTKNHDYSITCNFKIQYVELPVAVPNPSVSAYGLRCYLKCEDGTFGKLKGRHLLFETNSDPPPADVISETVSLGPPSPDEVKPSEHYSVEGKPPYAYADVKFVVEEFRAGIIQHEEAFSFGLVMVP
jgi:hypothetical protein